MDGNGGDGVPGHTWGTRPSEFLVVRDKNDLHNISQDSGLSHSPIQQETPQLTIGKPIKLIDNLHSTLKNDEDKKDKGSKWTLGGLFKKRSGLRSSETQSELSNEARSRGDKLHKKVTNNSLVLPERNASAPPLPPKNSHIFQPTMQVRGQQPPPVIFPHLPADLQYPEAGTHIVSSGGYYYDPRFGYVRPGSVYDQQIAAMAAGHARVSRESTLSHDRSSGVHSMTRSSVHSDTSSLDTMRSWRNQKQVIMKNAEQRRSLMKDDGDSSGSEDERLSVGSSVRTNSLSRVGVAPGGVAGPYTLLRRAGSTGSLHRRSRTARTERYLHRKSRDEESIVHHHPGQDDNRPPSSSSSPYVHTSGHRSLSADHTHNNIVISATPPPPPPRDPRVKQQLLSQIRGRPVSYSFEHLRGVPGSGHPRHRSVSQQSQMSSAHVSRTSSNHLPLPPRHRPHSSHCGQFSGSDLSLGISLQSPSQVHPRPHHQSTPVRHQDHRSPPPYHHQFQSTPVNHQNGIIHNYVDQEPRSRRPIHIQHQQYPTTTTHQTSPGSNASSEGIGSQTSLDDNCSGGAHVNIVNNNQGLVTRGNFPPNKTKHQHCQDNLLPQSPPPTSISKSNFISGKCSPASISSKDSGCSAASTESHPPSGEHPSSSQIRNTQTATLVNRENNNFAAEDVAAGFSTQKRRSRFEEAIKELEVVYNNIANDEDLLDRAERRDLPTAHQLLIWKDRESDTNASLNTSGDTDNGAVSDFDNFLNWNTSSSFEHISGLVSPRLRTPGPRRSGVSDKVADDMMVRRMEAANKIPRTMSTLSELGNTSYLNVSSSVSCVDLNTEWDPDEPDIVVDDVATRNIRDANQIKVIEPQPKFGVPLGPVTGGANSDYLHAVPDGKYRSTFNSMRNPDLVKDDLAFRHLRKDDNLGDDPSQLGIVRDPHGLITNHTNWPPDNRETTRRSPPVIYYPNKNNQIMRSLSGNIAQIIKKQSSRPGARLDDIITYQDLNNPLVYDCMKYTMDLINKENSRPKVASKSQEKLNLEKYGTTVYDLLRQHKSDPENINNVGEDATKDNDTSDEGVSSVSSPDLSKDLDNEESVDVICSHLPDLVTGDTGVSGVAHQQDQLPTTEAGETKSEPENHHEIVVQSCLIEQNNIDLGQDKEKYFIKPSYITSLVEEEESKRLSLKTLSDGGSFDNDDDQDIEKVTELHKIQSELQEVVDKIDLSIKEGQDDDGVIKEESETTTELPETERSRVLHTGGGGGPSEHVVRVKKPDYHQDDDMSAAPSDMLGQLSLGLANVGGGEAVGGCKLSDPNDEDLSLPGV